MQHPYLEYFKKNLIRKRILICNKDRKQINTFSSGNYVAKHARATLTTTHI